MTSHAVPVRCCCMDDLQAVVQASVDQLVGFAEFIRTGMLIATAEAVTAHTDIVCAFIQEYLDDCVKNHGGPDAAHRSAAVKALMKHLGH